MLNDIQRVQLLPSYVCRTKGEKNLAESVSSYKRLYDKSGKPASYEIGQEVLLKKNFGNILKLACVGRRVRTSLLKNWVQLT